MLKAQSKTQRLFTTTTIKTYRLTLAGMNKGYRQGAKQSRQQEVKLGSWQQTNHGDE